MQRDDAYLLDILDAAKLAATYVSTKSKETFLRDTQCQDAVIRRLEIIGEAAPPRTLRPHWRFRRR